MRRERANRGRDHPPIEQPESTWQTTISSWNVSDGESHLVLALWTQSTSCCLLEQVPALHWLVHVARSMFLDSGASLFSQDTSAWQASLHDVLPPHPAAAEETSTATTNEARVLMFPPYDERGHDPELRIDYRTTMVTRRLGADLHFASAGSVLMRSPWELVVTVPVRFV